MKNILHVAHQKGLADQQYAKFGQSRRGHLRAFFMGGGLFLVTLALPGISAANYTDLSGSKRPADMVTVGALEP